MVLYGVVRIEGYWDEIEGYWYWYCIGIGIVLGYGIVLVLYGIGVLFYWLIVTTWG